MRITVISGRLSGARFVRGLLEHLRSSPEPADVTVVVNTGDDISLWGLRVCPDIDHLLVELGTCADDPATHRVASELEALQVHPQWYPVTDREVGTHLARTAWLGQGATLSEVTTRLADRRDLAAQGLRILPMSDVPVETHAVLDGPEEQQAVHVQQWRHELGSPSASRFVVAGMDRAVPAPGVLDALRAADVILLAPSDPVLSIGIVMGVPGVRDALRGASAPVVGVSPVVAGRAVLDPVDASLAAVGVEATAPGVASLYRDLLDGWIVDPGERTSAGTWTTRAHSGLDLSTRESARDLAAAALGLAVELTTASAGGSAGSGGARGEAGGPLSR